MKLCQIAVLFTNIIQQNAEIIYKTFGFPSEKYIQNKNVHNLYKGLIKQSMLL